MVFPFGCESHDFGVEEFFSQHCLHFGEAQVDGLVAQVLVDGDGVVDWMWEGDGAHVLVSFSDNHIVAFAEGFVCGPLSRAEIYQ